MNNYIKLLITAMVLSFLVLLITVKTHAEEVECENDCITPIEEVTPTPEVTPEVTPDVTATPSAELTSPSNPGGPGDGRSDGRSSCPECTKNNNVIVPLAAPKTGRAE